MLAGTVADFNKAFGVNLKTYAYDKGTYRGRIGTIQIPARAGGHRRGRVRPGQPAGGQTA